MTNTPAHKSKHLASSPFKPKPEPVIEDFAVGERVTHDIHGLGRVISMETSAALVDFGAQTLRVPSPYAKMHHL